MKLVKGYLIVLFASVIYFGYAQTGSISGTITDAQTGESLFGVNVIIDGIYQGSVTDFDGHFVITNIQPGVYNFIVSYISYKTDTIRNISILAGQETNLNYKMKEASITMRDVVVSKKRTGNTENALLTQRKKSENIEDAISSQEMKKMGTSNAAESMQNVTGVSVVGGKYLYVRGLGDRYSSTQLNGQTLPSTDPYRNSTPLDIIPASLLDNIVASKSFTPDKPGNFVGGNVDLKTKTFPEKLTVSVSSSIGYNTQSSLNKNFLTYDGGKLDWLGYDDGTRGISDILADSATRVQLTSGLAIKSRKNDSIAAVLDEASKSVSTQMEHGLKSSPVNHAMAFAIGNTVKLFKKDLGFLFGINYSRQYALYNGGVSAGFELNDPAASSLNDIFSFSDSKSTETPKVGGLFNIAYKIHENHSFGFNVLYNHSASKLARYQSGAFPGALSAGTNIFETRTLSWQERTLFSTQIFGKHKFEKLNNSKIEWGASNTATSQKDPDLRFFANDKSLDDSLFYISPSEYDLPFHFFRTLNDEQLFGKIDVTIPFLTKKSETNSIKFGVYYSGKTRNFIENRFQIDPGTPSNTDPDNTYQIYAGNPGSYFAPENTGWYGYSNLKNRNLIGNFITNQSVIANNYSGHERVAAGYFMTSYSITNKLKFVGGVRMENTSIEVISADASLDTGSINNLNLLPATNLIYTLDKDGKQKLRASYSRTLARPNMRELAPFVSFQFIGGYIYVGNPTLELTNVNNYDIRWEWFPNYGDLIAVSYYHKDFFNPIISSFNSTAANPEISFVNVDKAVVDGIELELRKKLEFLSPKLKNVKVGANISIIKSKVDIPKEEVKIINQYNPEIGSTRPFQGQSPYLINAFIGYSNDSVGLDITTTINVFGARLAGIGVQGTPDILEQPRPQLNMVVKKSIGKHFSFKVTAKNLLNASYRKEMSFKGIDYTLQSYKLGRTFSIGVSYLY